MHQPSVIEAAMTDTLALSAGHQLRAQAQTLAEAVVACMYARDPSLRVRYGADGRQRSRLDAACHLSSLADALDAGSPALLHDHLGWVKVLQHHQGVRGEDLDHQLRCLADVLTERLPDAVARPAVAMIEHARAALPALPNDAASFIDPAQPLSPLAHAYLRSLLSGCRQEAARQVFDAAERGEPLRELCLRVFQPAMQEVGRLWQTRKISVAQEHFSSAATQIVMSQLLARAPAAPASGGSIVVACVSGDQHDMGARMVSHFFEMAGWDSYCCGANTPHDAVVQALVERGADVLAVSVTLGYHLHVVRELIDAVRADARCAGVRIMVGGRPFSVDPGLWRAVGADGNAADADGAVALAGQWLASSVPAA